MRSKLITLLSNLVMNERQAKIYIALLEHHGSTASELHRYSGVALSKTYEILKFLTISGYCIKRTIGKTITYYPIEPDLSFEQIINAKKGIVSETREVGREIL